MVSRDKEGDVEEVEIGGVGCFENYSAQYCAKCLFFGGWVFLARADFSLVLVLGGDKV